MAEYDRRQSGGHHNSRKRRYRDDDDFDRRPQRRRPDHAPVHVRIRRQLLNIAESPLRRWHEEIQSVASLAADGYDDAEVRDIFPGLAIQLAEEQPLKTPFVAAVVVVANTLKPEVVDLVLARAAESLEAAIAAGEWRKVKLYLKLLACMQGCLAGDGVFPILEELFSRAVDLQTASSDDTIGTELVKIILLTIPYIIAAAPGQAEQKAAELMDKTEIIASEPHALQALIDPYVPENDGESATPSASLISLLQKQLQAEAANNWELACLPRPWKMPLEEIEAAEKLENAPKHDLPAIAVSPTVVAGPRPLFPEIWLSVYGDQDFETVPPVTNIAASLIRDALLDTINILDFNRNASARFLIDIDCFFSDTTFVKRATPYDRLREVEAGRSTWKPEDVAVDTVFSQIFQLPKPEHKLVYFHSVLTEACKIAPAAIAPSLGRAIRFLYKNTSRMDLELSHRCIDWFSHHLSNFGFTWKWTEWVDDINLPEAHPQKAFILGALDKEIRLSFAKRIRNTLPEPLQVLIGPDKEKDVPDFKFADPGTPFSAEGREIAALLKRKVPDEEIQPVMDRIRDAAIEHGHDPLVACTDVFMTAVCSVGSKSLSHVLACIERTQGRLLDLGASSDAARGQIIGAVMAYWGPHPGVAISIVEKLLNYSILTPTSVVGWALADGEGSDGGGANLARAHVFEMVFNTTSKVTGRVRQVVSGGAEADDEMRERETAAMRSLFQAMGGVLEGWAAGGKGGMMEDGEQAVLIQRWGARWLRVFKRRWHIEEAFLLEASKDKADAEDIS